ncbi:hypothetical protein [Wolbachia endosymbiont of Psylliodes chrysocephala]|uniref:hypothetical protein n=1 Tax=Wolbachia endosymbiont of Psylliodes chrysocephala TaxID=2883236 RepID=UPI00209E0CC6|nr:hypothetical protein [Wolbachia endosymbiont of Psylliodes chrysocephala]
MGNLYNKNNASCLMAGAFATLVLLASGTLAVAPYVKFLSSVVAFNVALPVALSLSILSILVLALSCKIISNNKKIEVEKNKFAEKEQELKQQFESKVQELENEITLGKEAKEAASKEVKNQLNKLTREKQGLESEVERLNKEIEQLKTQQDDAQQKLDDATKELNNKGNQIRELEGKIGALNNKNKDLHDENTELSAKVKGQLKHKEEMLSLEHQELRDENTRLNERVDFLMEELCQCKLESEKNKLCLKSEYEDELNLELEHKSREASSLRTQLTMLRKKVEVEEVKQLKTLESEKQHESSESDIEELEKKLCQSEKEKKELEGKVSDER